MIPRRLRVLFNRIHGTLVGAISVILGIDGSAVPSPERIRTEYLVGFLLLVEPVVFASVLVDFKLGFGVFTRTRLAIGVLILVMFVCMRRGFVSLGLDLMFFGGVSMIAAGYFLSLGDQLLSRELFPLVILVLFAAIVLYGVYAEDLRRVYAIFATAVIFDVVDFVVFHNRHRTLLHTRLGIIALHVLAFGLAVFLKYYFERLARLAEARRVMNRRLEELVSEARSAGIKRLETLSHDIRSPITGILGVHDLLASTKLDAEQTGYLRILEKSNRLLLGIVESILDHDTGAAVFSAGTTSMRAFLDDALSPYGARARAKGVLLKRRVVGNPPLFQLSRADAARVIGNLVDNALKYTDIGNVTITARGAVDFSGVDLTVADSGCGMSTERLEAIRSGRICADEAVSGSRGLGLASVRRLVEDSGGVMIVESEWGKGTRVTLRFPLPENTP